MRVVARVAYYIIITTKCATRVRWMPTTCHHASFIDTLPMTNQRGLRSVGSLRLASIQSRPVATSGIQSRPVTSSGNKWQQVASSHVQWQQVASSGNKWHPVTSSGGNRCLLVAVRSHFGLRLGGRINPERVSTSPRAVARVHRMPTTCHHASFIDTLSLTNQRGLRSVGSLRLAIVQWQQMAFKCPVATGGNR